MNHPLKNSNPLWNGCFALPRKLNIVNGQLIQKPVEVIKDLREKHFQLLPEELPVSGPVTSYRPIRDFRGDQLEINLELDLHNAAFCGMNVLCDAEGKGGLSIVWSGNLLNVDGK